MSALEQVVGFPIKIFVDAENEVDDIVERALLTGMPDTAIEYGLQLMAGGHLTGLKLCKLLYELEERWPQFSNNTDDDVQDAVFKGMGVPTETFRKYSGIWRNIFANENIKKEYRTAMRNKPMGGLIDISVASRGKEFNDEDWKELVAAHDKASMRAVRDRRRGIGVSETRRLVIIWERDGRLSARRGNEGPEEVGFLPRRTGVSVVDDAVRRIVDAAGIVER